MIFLKGPSRTREMIFQKSKKKVSKYFLGDSNYWRLLKLESFIYGIMQTLSNSNYLRKDNQQQEDGFHFLKV